MIEVADDDDADDISAFEDPLDAINLEYFDDPLDCVSVSASSPPKPEDVPECCICMESLTKTTTGSLLKCQHTFHVKCVGDWFARNPSCPLCRTTSNFLDIDEATYRRFATTANFVEFKTTTEAVKFGDTHKFAIYATLRRRPDPKDAFLLCMYQLVDMAQLVKPAKLPTNFIMPRCRLLYTSTAGVHVAIETPVANGTTHRAVVEMPFKDSHLALTKPWHLHTR